VGGIQNEGDAVTATYDKTLLEQELSVDEGIRAKPYKDTVGKTTIGIGRNLDDVGVSADEIGLMLQNDLVRTEAALDKNLPWWRQMDPVRQRVIMNLAFNMGAQLPGSGLLSFTNTLAAMAKGNYSQAADGMASSKWATQVGARATRLIAMMRTGVSS
jgi:lysozyme